VKAIFAVVSGVLLMQTKIFMASVKIKVVYATKQRYSLRQQDYDKKNEKYSTGWRK
jgi:hypothetical protein